MRSAQLLKKQKRSDNTIYNAFVFDDGVEEIRLYGFNITANNKKRRYLIELHISNGFAMVKFYPKCLKNNKQKFQLRGKEQIGFTVDFSSIRELLYACALVMRDYLDENQNCFVGYIGQTDDKDNRLQKKRVRSQRSDIYNLLTNSIFIYPKYKLSSRLIFEEVNLRLIRKVTSKQEGKITKIQMKNYNLFLDFFEKNKDKHLELMTEKTRNQYL